MEVSSHLAQAGAKRQSNRRARRYRVARWIERDGLWYASGPAMSRREALETKRWLEGDDPWNEYQLQEVATGR